MHFSHRPTWADAPERRDTDRAVICDGVTVARITRQEWGPREGKWKWASMWSGLVIGETDTLDEALAEVKAAVLKEVEDNPALLDELRTMQTR